jgi:hypothetical protein
VTGEHPDRFRDMVQRAVAYARASGLPDEQQLVFVASLNEWSEGHYLEPDTRFGLQWMEAVRDGRAARASREEWGSERSEERGSSHDEAAERVFERAGPSKQQ